MMSSLPDLSPGDRRLNLPEPDSGSMGTATIGVAFTELRNRPAFDASIDSQLIYGESVTVYKGKQNWSLVQAERDNYVGWLESSTLTWDQKPATHIVWVPRTFFYPEPDLKLPHKGMRSMGSAVRVSGITETRGTEYALLETGESVIADHLRPADKHEEDYVSVAETLIFTPYLWAGSSAFGIDCSGLVKLSMFMCGKNVLRDSDMQAATIGCEIDPGEDYSNVRRGDLIFWRGHVAICQGVSSVGTAMIIHANGHTMNVSSEPLLAAIDRIDYLYEKPIGVRRPEGEKS